MESLYKRKVYLSMRKKKAAASKRRAQIGLSARLLDDSDEESCASTTSCSSASEYEDRDSTGTEATPGTEGTADSDEELSSSGGDGSESSGKRVSQSRRKRPALPDSSSDSDSDVGSNPKRKAVPRKRIRVQSPASDSDAEDSPPREKKRVAEAKQSIAKRKQRQNKLLELSKKMKSRAANRRSRQKDSGEEEEAEELAEKSKEKAEKSSEEKAKKSREEKAGGGSDKEDGDKEDKDGDNNGDDGDAVGDEQPDDQLIGSSQEELKDSDSLNDFIVEDEKGEEEEEEEGEEELDPQQQALLSLPREFITGSQLTHFQVVVKALLINVLDETFLKSLYSGERTKRYAQEMKTSLFHFDERTVLPRLENLKQRSRWSSRYKERVECYPKVRVLRVGMLGSVCEACQLHRQCSFTVKLSGQLYDNNTLQEDHFMPNDTQAFNVGSVCASRTEVYHILKHFKYHLFQHCRTVLEEEKKGGEEEEAVKDTVNRVFVKLQDGGWISEQYDKFQDHLNNADFFQEEKLD